MPCAKKISEGYRPENGRSGQAMLIAVLSLGGAILGATTVAGLLTLYQIRATTDTGNSAKAIFAADAGVEWALFSHYCGDATPSRCTGEGYPSFSNAARVQVDCFPGTDATVATTTCDDATTAAAISSGVSGGAERAFFVGVSSATSSFP